MKRYVTSPERVRMRQLRQQRLSYAAIGRLLNRPWRTVRDHVLDIPPPPEGWPKGGKHDNYHNKRGPDGRFRRNS